jgi:hypothetical protein
MEQQGRPGHRGRGMGKIMLIAVLVVAVGAAGGALWMLRTSIFGAGAPAPKQEYAVKQEPAPAASPKEDIVKDVVREVTGARRTPFGNGISRLPYEELSFSEKIGYEVLFAKNVTELIARAVPAGIGLHALEADNFQTFYAVGIAPSKELVQSVFATLKAEKVTLLPKPLTSATPNASGGIKFAFTGKAEFGLNPADPIVSAPIAANQDLPKVLQAFERTARENSIAFVKAPAHVSSDKVGPYYRHLYQWSGQGSYKNFVKFVVRLSQAGQFCAFKRISVTALSPASVKIEAQVLITTHQ